MNGDPAAKQRFLERAKALSELSKPARYLSVTELICNAVAFRICNEAEVFLAAYDDPKGKEYWEAYLAVAISVSLLANVLSAHSSENIEDLEYRRFATLRAFRGAAEGGERWFAGAIEPLLAVEEFDQIPDGLGKVRVQPRAAVEWLLGKPIFEHLIPEPLRLFLQNETITAAVTTEKIPEALDAKLLADNSPRDPGTKPRTKSRPAFERARRVIEKLHPDGVPDQATESNKRLCKQVNDKLKEMDQQPVSQDTVERAADRRK